MTTLKIKPCKHWDGFARKWKLTTSKMASYVEAGELMRFCPYCGAHRPDDKPAEPKVEESIQEVDTAREHGIKEEWHYRVIPQVSESKVQSPVPTAGTSPSMVKLPPEDGLEYWIKDCNLSESQDWAVRKYHDWLKSRPAPPAVNVVPWDREMADENRKKFVCNLPAVVQSKDFVVGWEAAVAWAEQRLKKGGK